jgi:chaperonin cofactor prefoldin
MGFINEGVEKNHEKLIAEIDDLLNSSVSWGVGQQYTQDFLRQMTQFKSELMKIYSEYQKVAGVINTLETPRTGKDLMILASAPQTTQVIDAYNSFKKLFDNFKPYLEQVERNFKKETYKIRQIQDKGWLSRVVDWAQILHGGWGLIADDFDDVVHAIAPYKRSIEETLTVLNEAETFEKDAQNKIQSALGTTTPEFGAEEPIPPAQQPGTTFVSSRPRTDIEGDAAELERELESVRIPISL